LEDDAPVETSNGSLASTLADVAASFMGTDSAEAKDEVAAAKLSRRARRRTSSLSSLKDAEFDPDALPRRQRRKLSRAERRARQRPSRRRVRKARQHQKAAAKTYARIERRARPSRRKRRQIRAAQRDLAYRQAKADTRSTRRRRRKLRKAEKALKKLTSL